MNKIESFRIDHLKLESGLYVSRRDKKGDVVVTTFDLRITAPNREPVIDMPALHTIEHLCATFLRNSDQKDDIVYFGPMGCRTGFYLLVRNADNFKVLEELKLALKKTIEFDGEIFGGTRKECGNYKCLSLDSAKIECKRYLDALNSKDNIDFKY